MNRPVEDLVLDSISAEQTLEALTIEASGTQYWYILLRMMGWDYQEIARHRGVSYHAVHSAVRKAEMKWLRGATLSRPGANGLPPATTL